MTYPVTAITASLIVAFVAATVFASLVARAGFPLPASEGRMGCIDGLRGYLALSVIGHHFIVWTQVTRLGGSWIAPEIPAFNELGAGAVGLFFMTTGFVFYRRILTGFQNSSWAAVYITRVFRILPLLGVSVMAVATIAMTRTGTLLSSADLPSLARWITCWGEPGLAGDPDAGRINAYVLWSLWFEWLFYIFVLPGSAALMDLIRDRLPSWIVPVTLLGIAFAVNLGGFRLPLAHFLPLFAFGMIAFEVRMRPAWATWLRSPIAGLIAVAALAAFAATFASPISLGLPAFAFFFTCVASGNSLFGLLNTRGALVLGEISFSLYLLHGLVLSLFFVEGQRITSNLTLDALVVFLPVLAVAATGVACVSYLAVERPAMRLGSSIASYWVRVRVRTQSPEIQVAP